MSVALGEIVNNPFGRNRLDQAGVGLAWDKTNTSVAPTPARGSEWVGELYYNYTVFKAMQLTPDVQVYGIPRSPPTPAWRRCSRCGHIQKLLIRATVLAGGNAWRVARTTATVRPKR